MVAPLVLTSLASVALGLYPQLFQAFIKAFGSF
jgi:hypothetical protein